MTEVPKAVTALAQGIAALHETIEELVDTFDIDGDGSISMKAGEKVVWK